MGLANITTNILEYVLGTAVISYLILAYLLFFSIGLFWSLFATFIYPDEFGSPGFLEIFNSIHLIVTILYGSWLTSQIKGYSNSIRNYKKLVSLIKDWCDQIYPIGKYADGIDTKINHIGALGAFIIVHLYKIHVKTFSFDIAKFIKDEKLTYGGESILNEVINKHNNEWKLNNIIKTIDFLSEIKIIIYDNLTQLLYEDKIKEVSFLTAKNTIIKIGESVDDTVINWTVNDPPIHDMTYKLIFIIYFFVFLPIQLWAQAGTFLGPFAFGIAGLVMLSPVIYQLWLGDPFDPKRPVLVNDHESLTIDMSKQIILKFLKEKTS